jgi:hypothetical protein
MLLAYYADTQVYLSLGEAKLMLKQAANRKQKLRAASMLIID